MFSRTTRRILAATQRELPFRPADSLESTQTEIGWCIPKHSVFRRQFRQKVSPFSPALSVEAKSRLRAQIYNSRSNSRSIATMTDAPKKIQTSSANDRVTFLNQRPASEAPYKGPPLPNVVEDLIVPNILPTPLPSFSSMNADERLWVPQAPGIHFRQLIFSVSQRVFCQPSLSAAFWYPLAP